VAVNGQKTLVVMDQGYVILGRDWKQGDTVQVDLPMPVRRIVCDERVKDNIGKITLQRGPLVYCIEWPDVEDGRVLNLVMDKDTPLETESRPDLLGGVVVIKGMGYDGRVEKKPRCFTAIPYYAWAHRGKGQMAVWIPLAQ
jgi:DUF1680 family protein